MPKREIEKVLKVIDCPWKPGYALVEYQEYGHGLGYVGGESKPIKIQESKSGRKYVTFEGKTYNVGYENSFSM